MFKENKRNRKINNINSKKLNFKIEEDYHRSPVQRLLHILCFITPVIMAFLGYFLSTILFTLIFHESASELVKFLTSLLLFTISVIFIFIRTRKVNPRMKMKTKSMETES